MDFTKWKHLDDFKWYKDGMVVCSCKLEKRTSNLIHHCSEPTPGNKTKGLVENLEKGRTWTRQKSPLKCGLTGFIHDCLLYKPTASGLSLEGENRPKGVYSLATKGVVILSAKNESFYPQATSHQAIVGEPPGVALLFS